MSNMTVNGDRLWRNLVELGNIGRNEKGISRVAFSKADIEARMWFLDKMKQAGLNTRIDGVGNVFGEMPGAHEKKILIGSHLDTVPEGGMFDGSLGVISAFECVQTLMENHVDTKYGVEVVGFSNEEGATVGSGLLGSRYFVEGIDKKEMEMLEPIVVGAGLSGISECKGCKAFDRSVYEFYVELHVEQGGVLDGEGYQIGVVQGIVGIHTYDFRFIGVSNHAGTTPMNQRRDALLGAANLIASIPKSVSDYGSGTTVGTCGQVAVYPGARNVIPGRVHLNVEVRDLQSEVADRVVEHLKKEADSLADAYGLRSETDPVSISQPAIMDARIQEIIRAVAEDLGLRAKAMPSGAGHDAAIFAKYVPTGMIFVPSKEGISHSPDEWTDPLDCINGANILLNTVLTLAK